ncbi:DUF2171 domain-containing protein [Novosphingobium sp.]|uniref:DUF2171 domain-containing protein n=1 Tax=Novosphingobium sp. TaxID=1874826 RepID=UPI002B47A59B|nr:DUF2171 domain-containing protein [Novosphingobium sp.]HKR91571.1 DUF2171 domain-containing protein [Novosphingobium sp.]
MTEPQPAPPAWHTPAGTIRQGMKVFAADGTCVGTVRAVDGEEVLLSGADPADQTAFIAVSQIDGVGPDGVLLSGRGDATFGLGAEP